jgi:hypothetical protein
MQSSLVETQNASNPLHYLITFLLQHITSSPMTSTSTSTSTSSIVELRPMSALPHIAPPSDGECYLLLLPNEVLAYISNWLPVTSMMKYFRACRLLHFVGSHPEFQSRIWEPQCKRMSYLYPSPYGDWRTSFQLNYQESGELKCMHCKGWFVTGERQLHGRGVCYECAQCKRKVPLSHALTCATCKLCGQAFAPIYSQSEACGHHPRDAVPLCDACHLRFPNDCQCVDRWSCKACKTMTRSGAQAITYCKAHQVRLSCCKAQLLQIPSNTPLHLVPLHTATHCMYRPHQAVQNIEAKFPRFFVAVARSAYYSSQEQGRGYLYQ